MLFRSLIAAALLTFSTGALAEEPRLAGLWRFDMISPKGATTFGAMTVMKNKDSGAYEGKVITNGGVEALPIRSLEVQSGRMTMEVVSSHGPILFRGQLDPSSQSFSGTARYHDGRDFSMAGVKQQALPVPLPGKANR